MRITRLIFTASALLALLTAPVLARNSNVPKTDEAAPAAPSACRAYQQAPDGSWIQLPCQAGSGAQAPAPRKSATKTPDQETR